MAKEHITYTFTKTVNGKITVYAEPEDAETVARDFLASDFERMITGEAIETSQSIEVTHLDVIDAEPEPVEPSE